MTRRTDRHLSTTLALALALVLCAFALVACGDGAAGGESDDDGGSRRTDAGGSGRMDAGGGERDAASAEDVSRGGHEGGAPDADVAPRDAGTGPHDDRDADPGDDDRDAGGDPGPELVWRLANLTNFESYPDPGSEECIEFSGCDYVGQFAFVDGQQSEEWVMMHNIVAVHSDDGDTYALKTLRLRQAGREIDVTVYDVCADSDCDGCCTENSRETGFLIDIERYTMERFGSGDGIVEWACLDCE